MLRRKSTNQAKIKKRNKGRKYYTTSTKNIYCCWEVRQRNNKCIFDVWNKVINTNDWGVE